MRVALGFCLSLSIAQAAYAGPPYVSDDPEPTDYRHFEIYTFNSGTSTRTGTDGETGIDFNYGGAPDLQLTATLPLGFSFPAGDKTQFGLSNVELAAKYRFLHQATFGWDVAVFPRVFLPSASNVVGDRNASLLLPVWAERDLGDGWTTFGGGGCQLYPGARSQNFCEAGWVLSAFDIFLRHSWKIRGLNKSSNKNDEGRPYLGSVRVGDDAPRRKRSPDEFARA